MERKEAIEIVRKLYNDALFLKKDKEAMATLIPELKESEDERIRKAMIKYFTNGKEYLSLTPYSREDYISWLEKHGEPTEINPTEFDTRLQALIGKFDSLPKEELIGSLSFWMNVVQNDRTYKSDEKQGEQKSDEWSEEDEKKLSNAIIQLKAASNIIVNDEVDYSIAFIKSLKERIQLKVEHKFTNK